MMDAFTEDEKVPHSCIPAPCNPAKADNASQRFVLAEYIKASQVETGQLVEFISESAAADLSRPSASRCAALLTMLAPRNVQFAR